MSEPTSRDLQRAQTRQRLYDAALEVFRRDGVEAARIDDIATMAGVARGTFYFHFPTKQDVLRELLQESQAALARELEALPDDATLDRVLDTVASAIGARWQDDPRLLAEVGAIALQVPREGLAAMATQHPAVGALVPRLRAAVERGELDGSVPPELLANFLLVNLFAASLAWVAAPVLPLRELLANVVAFFLRGARA